MLSFKRIDNGTYLGSALIWSSYLGDYTEKYIITKSTDGKYVAYVRDEDFISVEVGEFRTLKEAKSYLYDYDMRIPTIPTDEDRGFMDATDGFSGAYIHS